MRATELFERKEIGIAMKAMNGLSPAAKSAITQWETSNWIGGELEQAVRDNNEIAQEIERAFAPIRATMPKNVHLYRAQTRDPSEHHFKRILESWTASYKTAADFSGRRKNSGDYQITLSPELIDKYVERYEKTGKVKVGSYFYVRNKQYPKYYDIYTTGDGQGYHSITDGDDLRAELEDKYEAQKEYSSDEGDAFIIERNIPREQIIWITNNLHSQEYIVRIR